MTTGFNNPSYVVVENAGMVGERDVATHPTNGAAWADLLKRYSDDERDTLNLDGCLFPDVRCDWTDDAGELHSEFGQ